jgi:hypothetical protein
MRMPPSCTKTYCYFCINGWYNYKQENRISCPSCQEMCYCTRCERLCSIDVFSQIYERLGGEIDLLVTESPSSNLATKLLETNHDFTKMLLKVHAERRTKESMTKAEPEMITPSYNSKYRPLHLLKLMCKLVTVVYGLS